MTTLDNNGFAAGQRWLSTTEQELGLGILLELNGRTLTILFPACDEQRVYALKTAPLTRVRFEQGEVINSHQGWPLMVQEVTEHNGLLTYSGLRQDTQQPATLPESQLDHYFQFDQADKRLFNGQLDEPKWFDLRRECFDHQYQHATSDLLGFVGARVDLIPHQLHIAAEVGRRHAPRVLLADEVGLGKTIEAGLIIHQQLLTQRAQRVLILLPPSLIHQWLVEMLRRVNLPFAIFDKQRIQAISEEGGNPFESEQRVICSLDYLVNDVKAQQQALAAGWDLLAVDEAHHLLWSADKPSAKYTLVETLANSIKGVLLLTATPDQLGHQSHFARLRLLDAARFHDYRAFVDQEAQYSELANAVKPLLNDAPIQPQQLTTLNRFASDTQLHANSNNADKAAVLTQLLDRHGTGRLLFRNARAGIAGFPKRKLFASELTLPEQYRADQANADLKELLRPERLHPESWFEFDPRVPWLVDLLQQLKGEKVLCICANPLTALTLAEALRVSSGIHASVFHEGMSIVERDKAANYFAQAEDGARVLICSEIGSEGRNFQFAHHLVLFDLPLIPDLLEQRIGRLDRIGQKKDISIHLPYFANSAQQVLMQWYHVGLEAFEHTCPTGTAVYEHMQDDLLNCLFEPQDQQRIDKMLIDSHSLHQQLKQKLEAGRDLLLELNSSGKGKIEGLIEQIEEADNSPRLERFMNQLFDALGVLQEDKDESSYLLKPTESMLTPLPGLNEEGMEITYERRTATQLEHLHFFSWDHPMIQQAMEMVTTDTRGKAAIALTSNKQQPPGTYWLECLFVLTSQAASNLQLSRFLPPTPIKLCLNAAGQIEDRQFLELDSVNQQTAAQLTQALKCKIEVLLVQAQTLAEHQAELQQQQALSDMQQVLGGEQRRLQALQIVNPSIRDEEIDFLKHQQQHLTQAIGSAKLRLEAIRLVINNPT